jgi:hypothetical protein
MLQAKPLLLAFVLVVLPLAVAQAAPPPPCTCELCLADPGVKCSWKENGSCVHLLRSGVCLDQAAEAATAPSLSLESEQVCAQGMSTRAQERLAAAELVSRAGPRQGGP